MSFSLLPDLIFPALTDVTPQALMARGIELLLLDFDNTIVPYTTDVPTERMETWLREMQKSGIRLCVVSNSKKPRVQVFCKAYGLDCITHAKKPFQRGIRAAKEKYGIAPEHMALFAGTGPLRARGRSDLHRCSGRELRRHHLHSGPRHSQS